MCLPHAMGHLFLKRCLDPQIESHYLELSEEQRHEETLGNRVPRTMLDRDLERRTETGPVHKEGISDKLHAYYNLKSNSTALTLLMLPWLILLIPTSSLVPNFLCALL